jgi:hypothetical protein
LTYLSAVLLFPLLTLTGGAGMLVERAQRTPAPWPVGDWRALGKRPDVDWIEIRRGEHA